MPEGVKEETHNHSAVPCIQSSNVVGTSAIIIIIIMEPVNAQARAGPPFPAMGTPGVDQHYILVQIHELARDASEHSEIGLAPS